jgi:hypothetical protein
MVTIFAQTLLLFFLSWIRHWTWDRWTDIVLRGYILVHYNQNTHRLPWEPQIPNDFTLRPLYLERKIPWYRLCRRLWWAREPIWMCWLRNDPSFTLVLKSSWNFEEFICASSSSVVLFLWVASCCVCITIGGRGLLGDMYWMFVFDYLMMARVGRNMLWGKEVNVSINIIAAIAGICLIDLCYIFVA